MVIYMKKLIFSILCTTSLILSSFTATAVAGSIDNTDSWPQGPTVYAEAAIVMEASTGLILYEKNMNETYYPASITKILSALLVIENSSPGEIITFSRDAIFNIERDSTHIAIDVGEQLTVQQCLYGILLESANEATYGAAEHIAGSIPAFSDMMNEKAKSLGALNSNFVNPHGLPDDNHYTTAYDMALITREAMKNEAFRRITATRTYQIPPTNKQTDTRYLRNHHKFILKNDLSYEGVIGGKTGFTSKARYTLVTIAKRGDLELICVILKDDTSAHQYEDTAKLLDFGFDHFSIYPINELESPNVIQESPFFTRYNSMLDYSSSSIITDEKGFLVLPNTASFNDAKKEVSFYPEAEIKEGHNVIGTISYTYDGMYVGGADIIFDNIKTPTLVHTLMSQEPSAFPTPEAPEPETSGGYFRPIIIGLIVGVFVLIIGLYFVLVERPRLKRRSAYYKKRANRKQYFSDDNFLDL
ncbi:MAG: D-alanyl-D-alanine carboxypeptidase [Anaerolineaceae bacterium]|nr:MAG: D-alanyl-D-alanine carboxypeptidase [Anaerolineaceae bacterium]